MILCNILLIISLYLGQNQNVKIVYTKSAVLQHNSSSLLSCQELPTSFDWLGLRYGLKSKHTRLEPGMKIGFMKCKNGQLVLDSDDWNSIIVYDASETADIDDMILITPGGQRFLYIPL